jgi:DNA-directed RNA polymerase sigma subunit (sigma70/sigma32)
MLDRDGREPELDVHIHDDAFTAEWLEKLRPWIRRQVDRRRLPSDFSADCVQDLLLQALEETNKQPATRSRAIAVRISKDAVRDAVLKEYEHQHSSAITTDDAERRLERTRGNDWLRRHFSIHREADAQLSDAELDAADARRKHLVTAAMNLIFRARNISETEKQVLRLSYMTLVPGQNRNYTDQEIAPMIGKKYDNTRKIHSRACAKVRQLLVDIIAERPLR